jgi:spore maturation protein B
MINTISNLIFPIFLISIFIYSIIKKNETLTSFVKGAKDGISTIFFITPNILAIMVATAMLRKSGALEYLLGYLTPILSLAKIPSGIVELIILRPISGSGALALLSEVYNKFGADSYEGLLASVIAASTETTLYTIMIYFGVTSAKKTKIPIMAGLITDAFVVFIAIIIINFIFY